MCRYSRDVLVSVSEKAKKAMQHLGKKHCRITTWSTPSCVGFLAVQREDSRAPYLEYRKHMMYFLDYKFLEVFSSRNHPTTPFHDVSKSLWEMHDGAHKLEGVRRTTVANSLPMLCVCPALECLVNWDADVVQLPQSTYWIACELLVTHILPEVPLWDSMYSIHSVNMQALISKVSDRGDCRLGLSCLVEGSGFAIQMVSVKVGIRLRRKLPYLSFFRICFCLRWLFISFTVTHDRNDHHGHQQTIRWHFPESISRVSVWGQKR